MRLQLVVVALVATVGTAHADGVMSMRGVYYKERATRVIQPMLDGSFTVGNAGLVNAHFLVDAITSASGAAGAENAQPFTENRYEAGGSYAHELKNLRLAVQGRFSDESDYTSLFGAVRGELDLAQKNTVLGLGVGAGHDTISRGAAQGPVSPEIECSPGDVRGECELTTMTMFASVTQILSKNAVAALTYDLARLDGYQANPYRQALTETGLVPERHPEERLRQAFAASLRYFVPATQTTLIGVYRYYQDDWDLHAHTPELRLVQQVSHTADAAVRYRFHTQDRAFFYRDRYPTGDVTMQEFLSDDVKLDAHSTHLVEAKLGILGEAFGMSGRWEGARFEGILQYALLHPRFGNAIVAHVALTVPFDY